MANLIRLKRASGSDPVASDLVSGEPAVRTDTGELFFKKDDGSVAKVSGAGGGPDFKYLALRNAANNGAASYPNADFTLVTSGTTTALTPTAANTLLVSVNGVIQKPNTGTSTPSSGFALSGSTIKFGGNISAAPDFILYQESGGIGEPSDATVSEAKLNVSNSPVNGYFLSAQSGNTGGLTWAAPVATSCTGNSATATALATARAINGVNFDGTAAITVTAAAGTLSGNTLNSSVVTSSLTSLGDLSGLTVNGDINLTFANGYSLFADQSGNLLRLGDSVKLQLGNTGDLQIYHDGTASIIDNNTGELKIQSDNFQFLTADASEKFIDCNGNGNVELYYDNSKKFETTSAGIYITGSAELSNTLTIGGELNLTGGSAATRYIDAFVGEAGTFALRGTNNADSSGHQVMLEMRRNAGVHLNYSGSTKFETTSAGATITGALTVDNAGGDAILGQNLSLVDNGKVKLGTGDDLQIYHDGSNSFIQDSGTGDLFVRTTAFKIQGSNSDDMIAATQSGAVELYHNNSKKFETTNLGCSITGELSLTSHLKLGDNDVLAMGAGEDLKIYSDGTNGLITNHVGGGIFIRANANVQLMTNASDGSAYNADPCINNGAVELYYDNAKKFETMADGVILQDLANNTVQVRLDTAQGQGGSVYANTASSQFGLLSGSGDWVLKSITDGAVELYHDNSKKLETTSGGVNVTGAITVNGAALGGGGKIGQVIQGTRASVFSTTSTSFVDVGLSASITPSASDSKILVFVSLYKAGTDNNTQRLLRNSTTIFAGNASGSRASGFGGAAYDGTLGDTTQLFNGGGFLDTPSTTSAITYKVQIAASGGGTVFVGRDTTDNNNAQHTRTMQTIILMEVLA